VLVSSDGGKVQYYLRWFGHRISIFSGSVWMLHRDVTTVFEMIRKVRECVINIRLVDLVNEAGGIAIAEATKSIIAELRAHTSAGPKVDVP